MLVSGVEQSGAVIQWIGLAKKFVSQGVTEKPKPTIWLCVCVCMCVFFCRCFSIIGYYKILNIISMQLTWMVSSNSDHSHIKYKPLVDAVGVTTKMRLNLSLHWVTGEKVG